MSRRDRADRLLVELGYFESRAAAQSAIREGLVVADGSIVRKPSEFIAEDATIEAERAHPFVSRGGVKLAHALDFFGVAVDGKICLDVGASTGGFTDVLVRRGAQKVYAVDVGRDQLHASLRNRSEIIVLEQQDARMLSRDLIPDAPDVIVCDASFIGLQKVLPVPLTLADSAAELIALFKPQFEVGPAHIGKGGRVLDDGSTDMSRQSVAAWFGGIGWSVQGWTESPITGGDGNREFLFHVRRAEAGD